LKLQELGFFPANLTPNGVFGPATEAAVKAFQKANGLAQVGFLGPGTRAALNGGSSSASTPAAAPAATPASSAGGVGGTFKSLLNVGSRSDEVKALQDKLKSLGYLDPSTNSTGFFGNLTAAAVKKFQSANGISPVGYVGPGTRAALNK
jgi:peptidoglycan hydrolase-like protein with peptidoglycan-binding domain